VTGRKWPDEQERLEIFASRLSGTELGNSSECVNPLADCRESSCWRKFANPRRITLVWSGRVVKSISQNSSPRFSTPPSPFPSPPSVPTSLRFSSYSRFPTLGHSRTPLASVFASRFRGSPGSASRLSLSWISELAELASSSDGDTKNELESHASCPGSASLLRPVPGRSHEHGRRRGGMRVPGHGSRDERGHSRGTRRAHAGEHQARSETGMQERPGGQSQLLYFRLLQPLRLGSAVLKPDLHLKHNGDRV